MKDKILLEWLVVFLTRLYLSWDNSVTTPSLTIISHVAERLTVHRFIALNIGSYTF